MRNKIMCYVRLIVKRKRADNIVPPYATEKELFAHCTTLEMKQLPILVELGMLTEHQGVTCRMYDIPDMVELR